MKRALLVGLALGFGLALVAPRLARAGEGGTGGTAGLIGIIMTSDAGTMSNIDTGYLNGLAPNGGFSLTTINQKLTIQCDQAMYVLTDIYGVDAGNGLKLAADEKLLTSLNSVSRTVATRNQGDGGSYTGGIVSILPVSTATGTCRVWARTGTE